MAKDQPTKTHCKRGHPTIPENVTWNGRSWSCKKCNCLMGAKNRRDRRAKDPISYWLLELQRNAKKRGQPFSITQADLMPLPTHCPVFGIELNYLGKAGRNAASVDRHDCKQGYIPGNVAVMSRRANTLKNDATPEELQQILDYLRRHHRSKGGV
jgi:hypothetical protein